MDLFGDHIPVVLHGVDTGGDDVHVYRNDDCDVNGSDVSRIV